METGTFITRDPLGFVDGPNMYAYVAQNPWTSFDPQGLTAVLAPLAPMLKPLIATPPGAVAATGALSILVAHEAGKAMADPLGQMIAEKFAQATGKPYLNADGQLVDPKGTGSLPDKNPPKVDVKQGEVTFIPAGATREDVEQFKKDREKGDPNAQEKLNQRVKERLNGGKDSGQPVGDSAKDTKDGSDSNVKDNQNDQPEKGVPGKDLPGKGEDWIKLKGDQGWKDVDGNIWKKDKLHKDHWDVSDRKGNKIKEVDFKGNKIWPNGKKNKNK